MRKITCCHSGYNASQKAVLDLDLLLVSESGTSRPIQRNREVAHLGEDTLHSETPLVCRPRPALLDAGLEFLLSTREKNALVEVRVDIVRANVSADGSRMRLMHGSQDNNIFRSACRCKQINKGITLTNRTSCAMDRREEAQECHSSQAITLLTI